MASKLPTALSHLLGDIDGIFYKVSYYKVENIPL